MKYHKKLGHTSFDILKALAASGILPQTLAKCRTPRCAGCLYGKQHCRPWRTKKPYNPIKPAQQPGETVLIDQLESAIPGFVPIAKGKPALLRYRGATIFADHFSGFTHAHLMTS